MPTPDRPPPTTHTSALATDPSIEAALRDPAALWDAIQRAAGDYIVIVDRQYVIRFLNRTGDGFSADAVLGHDILDFAVDETKELLRAAIDEVFRFGEKQTLQTRVLMPTAELRMFSVQVGPIHHQGAVAAAIVCSEDITSLKKSEIALQHERSVLRRLIDIQEKERQLVSYEIHDGLAQYIAGAIMHLEAHLHAHATRESEEVVEGLRLLRAAAEESRRLIGGLRPPALDELGIVEAIESLVADARIEIPQVTFTHGESGERLPAALETTIFRLVQESLTNARRHAEARSANVSLERVPGGMRVCISDDGRGFDLAKVPDNRFGLEGMLYRCRLAGAEPRIESAPGTGTVIDVVLPLPSPGA